MLAQDIKTIMPDLPVVDMQRARAFYEKKLGFEPAQVDDNGVFYQIGSSGGLFLYQHAATKADHTEASFIVNDLVQEMSDLRAKGVVFEEYDMPEIDLKTIDGVATYDGLKSAWFKDTEGNILNISQMT
jgi:catechol 2,3-dioxygenase-like lactoylglutathione lyase family enzyme